MTGHVEIRAARPAEYPAVLETVCAAFGERVRPYMTAMLWGDPTLTTEDIRVAAVDGAIASVVRIADRPIRYGTATLRLAGVGAVSTHPDYQGRGLASRVLEDAACSMRERGYHLAMLFTGIQPFYARLGWTAVSEPGFRVVCSPLPRSGEGLGEGAAPRPEAPIIRPFDQSRDLPAIMRIYDAFNAGRFGPYLRTSAYWRCAHSRERNIMPSLVAEQSGEVIAYASTTPPGNRLILYEAACLPGAGDAFDPLASAIIGQAQAHDLTAIEARLPPGHGLRRAFQHMKGATVEDRSHPGMMLLPLDLPALCQAAASQGLPDWSAPLKEGAARPVVYWWPDHF